MSYEEEGQQRPVVHQAFRKVEVEWPPAGLENTRISSIHQIKYDQSYQEIQTVEASAARVPEVELTLDLHSLDLRRHMSL